MNVYVDEVPPLMAPLGNAGDLDVLLDRIGDARFVLLGEASHGTQEYYPLEWAEFEAHFDTQR